MARIADLFTNGGYSKALKERDAIAGRSTGQSGYSNAQTLAMQLANDYARGRSAEILGNNSSMPLSERIAAATQANATVPADFYDFISKQQRNDVNRAGNRVAQQQANAMNKQARIGQGLESVANAAATGMKVGSMVESENVAPPDPNTAQTPKEARNKLGGQ